MAFDADSIDLPMSAPAVERRAALFRETPLETIERWALGTHPVKTTG